MKLQNSIKHYWGINSFSTALATTSSDELLVKAQMPRSTANKKKCKKFKLQRMSEGR